MFMPILLAIVVLNIETKAQAFESEVAGSRDLFSGPFFMQVVTLAKIYRFCSPLGVRFEL